jgi:L-fucose mutarotase/ribose pyranase (RbsD/FucU family)
MRNFPGLKKRSLKFSLGNLFFVLILLTLETLMCHASDWKTTLENELPVLGHRNWIVIADSAYPAQTGGGIEVIATRTEHFQVLEAVLDALKNSRHVRPLLYMDAELGHVAEKDAPGIGEYRQNAAALLKKHTVTRLPHMDLIMKLDASAKNFRVLVFKTDLALPYTSVFMELDCGYWSSEAESRLREAMKKSGVSKP